MLTFAELKIGDTFEFDHANVAFTDSLASGPWIKISPRKYRRIGDRLLYSVGYIHVSVKRLAKEDEMDRHLIDEFTSQHLASFMVNHVPEQYHEAFRNYALSRLDESPDYWMNLGWSVLYGHFLMK